MRRRLFIQKTAGLAAGIGAARSLAGQTAVSNSRVPGANDRIRVALIGCGGMGRGDLRDFLRVRNTQCVALCDVDRRPKRRAPERDRRASASGPAISSPSDFRRVLDRKDIDAVIVGTPDHWHALPTIMACQAGKDVYVEKPLSVTHRRGPRHGRTPPASTTASCRWARSSAAPRHLRRRRRLREERQARQDPPGHAPGPTSTGRARSPALPDEPAPLGVDYDMWLGPAPQAALQPEPLPLHLPLVLGLLRRPDDRLGRAHDRHRQLGHGHQGAVRSGRCRSAASSATRTTRWRRPTPSRCIWEFADFSMVWEHALGIGRGPEAREHGVAFHGNNGVLVIDRAGWEVYPRPTRSIGRRASTRWPACRARASRGTRTTTCCTCRTSSIACAAASARSRTSRSATTR